MRRPRDLLAAHEERARYAAIAAEATARDARRAEAIQAIIGLAFDLAERGHEDLARVAMQIVPRLYAIGGGR